MSGYYGLACASVDYMKELIKGVEYPGLTLEVREMGLHHAVVASISFPSIDPYAQAFNDRVVFSAYFGVPPEMTKHEFADAIFTLLLSWQSHEICERLTVSGQRPYKMFAEMDHGQPMEPDQWPPQLRSWKAIYKFTQQGREHQPLLDPIEILRLCPRLKR